MWRNFSPALLALGIFMAGCVKHNPVDSPDQLGEDLITNGTFATTLQHGRNITTGEEAPPWLIGYGSPQIGAGNGCDAGLGYLQIWGNKDLGESAYQELEEPIRKGKTYILTACARFMDDNPANYTRHVRVRFVAVNTIPPGFAQVHWKANPTHIAVIGSLTTSDVNWKEFTLGEWTADANYRGFLINAENDTPDNNTPHTVSWVKVDNVSLREKNKSEK